MRRLSLALALLAPACVPADGSFPLGSAQFDVRGSTKSVGGFDTLESTNETWHVEFDRVVLGFRTMTIGKVGDDDRCSFRGRGERSDIVFDPRARLTQTFNGITPAICEDTGIFLSPPGDTTEVGPGVTSSDLVELGTGDPAHAIVDATAHSTSISTPDRKVHIHLRFDTATTSSRFGGCSGRFNPDGKGIRVRANERIVSSVIFAPENLFQEGLGFGGRFRVAPFEYVARLSADPTATLEGGEERVMTLDDADRVPIRQIRTSFGDGYQLPSGAAAVGTFGDYLRALFRFTFFFQESGTCVGNEPGEE